MQKDLLAINAILADASSKTQLERDCQIGVVAAWNSEMFVPLFFFLTRFFPVWDLGAVVTLLLSVGLSSFLVTSELLFL
jgi:hypothetical protein